MATMKTALIYIMGSYKGGKVTYPRLLNKLVGKVEFRAADFLCAEELISMGIDAEAMIHVIKQP